ncbi:hypothetical protein [Amycolatopsis sp. lyj-108]|uniref:hypothetical protein n=1 Tax=Amycolatopsis sp. lyj-108 TaxID=2789286 RepID=UPI003978E901
MTVPTGLAAPHPLSDQFVLHARPLRSGAVLDQTSRFGDDKWLLDAAVMQSQTRSWMLNFESIPVQYRLVAKELCYAMLSGPLPPGEPRPKMASIRTRFSQVKTFLDWLDTRRPPSGRPVNPTLAECVGQDLLAFQRHFSKVTRSAEHRTSIRGTVRYFWRYRTVLTVDRLPFDPVNVDGWGEPAKRRAAPENATDRIPELVHGPLLVWALRFIDDFSEDILAASNQWWALRDPARRPGLGVNRGAAEKLRSRLGDYLARGRPLPGYAGKVNILQLAKEAGCDRTVCERLRPEIDAAIAVVGVSAHTYLDVQVGGSLDGQRWIDGITTDHTEAGLACLARMLQTAAAIVVLFLSGMRDSEVKHLRRGCVRAERDEQGRTYRWNVVSLAFKGEDDPYGVEATWVVGAPAVRAIQVLERLQPEGTDLLFTSLGHGPGGSTRRAKGDATLTNSSTNRGLNEFVAWVNDYCVTHGRADGIPMVDKKPWRLSTRQFRRTLAWFIARRPGGAIAGAIAYRHLSVQMFEGYAGTSDSGFRAEVESEEALARGEHLLAMIDQHEHEDLAGPAADEAARRLEEFGERVRFRGQVITDKRRLDRLLKRDDPAIYPGKYVTCVHKHATALCQQRRDSHDHLRPNLGDCKPLACRNVALTADNIGSLREEMAGIGHEIASRPLLPPLVQHQLQGRRADIAAFLARHISEEEK